MMDDQKYLKQCQDIRESLSKPLHSQFRVIAILLLQDGQTIVGSNDEPSHPGIAGSICAERAAFLRLRLWKDPAPIVAIYIVTDAGRACTPGMLCRQYMWGLIDPDDTRIVLQSCERDSDPLVLSLRQLYPYPSIYRGLGRDECVQLGEKLKDRVSNQWKHIAIPGLTTEQVQALLECARAATARDTRDALHPIRYGAAALLSDASFVSASQLKSIEFGSTLDPVCQMASSLVGGPPVVAVVVVDQFDVPHAPFATGRSFLAEYGYEDAYCVVTKDEGEMAVVTVKNLHPYNPSLE